MNYSELQPGDVWTTSSGSDGWMIISVTHEHREITKIITMPLWSQFSNAAIGNLQHITSHYYDELPTLAKILRNGCNVNRITNVVRRRRG